MLWAAGKVPLTKGMAVEYNTSEIQICREIGELLFTVMNGGVHMK